MFDENLSLLEAKKHFLRSYGYSQEMLDKASEESINILFAVNKNEQLGEIVELKY